MGIYSSSQFMGSFIGGLGGGWLYGDFGANTVFLCCAIAATVWLVLALFMKPPQNLANLLVPLEIKEIYAEQFMQDLLAIKGIKEARLHFEESVAYLKVDNQQLETEMLQCLLSQWSIAKP